jgi:glycosyltransferase involved in cell wall biosynthesis
MPLSTPHHPEPPAIVDVFIVADGIDPARTLASLKSARCRTPERVAVVTDRTALLSGLARCQGEVAVLRAGTEVGPDWLDRLAAAARSNDEVASIIPFSNVGPLGGYPGTRSCDPESDSAIDWASVDRVAASVNRGATVTIPWPGSCCVFLKPGFLADCRDLGDNIYGSRWQHRLAADVCVRWTDSADNSPVSLAADGGAARSCDLGVPTHPFAAAALDEHLRCDAARFYRRRLDLARIRGHGPAMLLVTHYGGGGTERHLHDLASALEDQGVAAFVLRPLTGGGLQLQRFAISATPNLVFHPEEDAASLLHALTQLNVRRVHIHHTLGHTPALRRLITDLGCPYDFTAHDYHVACPRVHLAGRSGRYCGEPGPDDCNRCLARDGNYHNVRDASEILAWRSRGHEWLAGARRVFVPHRDVGRRLGHYFPDIVFTERPHPEILPHARPVAAPLAPGQPLRVAVLGALVQYKGRDVLLDCARDSRRRRLPLVFVVIGPVDQAEAFRDAGVPVSGVYREEEVFDLIESNACHCALFLTTVPETYCFTLSIAQASGLYCIGFDLGAQGDRIRQSGWGQVLSLDTSPPAINDHLMSVGDILQRGPAPQRPVFRKYPDILRDYYGLDAELQSIDDSHHPPTVISFDYRLNTTRIPA